MISLAYKSIPGNKQRFLTWMFTKFAAEIRDLIIAVICVSFIMVNNLGEMCT